MNWKKLQQDGEDHVDTSRKLSAARRSMENAQEEYRVSRMKYGRCLQSGMNRTLNKIGGGGCVTVRVAPLIDHANGTCDALAEIQWYGKGGRFSISAIVRDSDDVARLVKRATDTMKLNRQ